MSIIRTLTGIRVPVYSGLQFTLFRMLLGSYLVVHFMMLVPYAKELFSEQGMIPNPSLQPTYSIFPNLLVWIDTPLGAQIFLLALAGLALAFTIGWKRPWVSFMLWYGWACLFNRNVFIANPGLAMVGWLLLACSLVPKGEPLSIGERTDEGWKVPTAIFWGAWLLMSLGYTVSGIHKLGSPSWADGTAIRHLLNNPLARDMPWREWLLTAPNWVFSLKTYGSLALEIFFLPLALLRWTRSWIWIFVVCMHLGILTLVSFADLTLGVLMIHAFTFDSSWIPPRRKKSGELVLFFDGVCGLCNGLVDSVIREDHDQRFRFSPLQSDFARRRLELGCTDVYSSSYLLDGGVIFDKSDAMIRLASHLGGIWRIAELARVVPRSLRNLAYDWIACNRYQWFGKKESCRIPTPQERQRFIL